MRIKLPHSEPAGNPTDSNKPTLVTTTERNPLPARNTLALRSHRAQTTSAFRIGSLDLDPTGGASFPERKPATVNTSISVLVPRS